MSSWIKTGAVLFALPIFAFLLFTYANQHQSNYLRDAFTKGTQSNTSISDDARDAQLEFIRDLDFAGLCAGQSEGDAETIKRNGLERECQEFTYFAWARLASLILFGLGILHIFLIALFARMAKRSRESLLFSFKTAWASSTFFSLVILLGQAVLGAVTFFYLTLFIAHAYFPKLILFILGAAAIAFWQVCKIMFSNPAPMSHEPTSEEVGEEAAPILWRKIREIARGVGTNPPDTLLLGMSTSFYVTEFPVVHSGGVSRGRTMHLSVPMMQQLSSDEVSAIIGHELGHFKGEDTVMTQKMSPQLIKSDNTLAHLHGASVVGMPAFYAMLAFRNLFETVIGSYRRERELAADAFGASCTSEKTSAMALVRYAFQNEVYDASLNAHLGHGAPMAEALAKFRQEYRDSDAFWESLISHGLPHPFDSHPPMNVRVETLGFRIEDLRAHASEPVVQSAFDVLMEGATEAIGNAVQEHERIVQEVQEAIAVRSADELSAETIAKHFPKLQLRTKRSRIAFMNLRAAFCVLIPMIVVFGFAMSAPRTVGIPILVVALLAAFYLWWRFTARYRSQEFTLDHHGVQLKSWAEMLRFADVESMSITVEGTFIKEFRLGFKLTESHVSFEKKPFCPWRRKTVKVNMSMFEGDPSGNCETVLRYFTRGLAH